MGDAMFLFEHLKKCAIKENNQELLKEINNPSFFDSLEKILKIFNQNGLELIKTNKEDKNNYQREILYNISKTLAKNYFAIYYVNILDNSYVSFSTDKQYSSLNISEAGNNFFEESKANALKHIYYKDQEKVIKILDKDFIIKNTEGNKTVTNIHRLVINDKPHFIELKAFRIEDDPNTLLVGLSDVDDQKRLELEYKRQLKENNTYFNIALSLVTNFFTVYYINTDDNSYIQYNIDSIKQQLEYAEKGDDFFEECKKQALKYLIKDDQEKFLESLDKDFLLNEIKNGKSYSLTYQQLIDNVPTYVQLTAINLINDKSHIIIAVSNIDKQKKKEEEDLKRFEFEKKIARTDALTGAKNKYCYNETQKELDKLISKGKNIEFAVLICDINNLKLINDTLGHDVGDKIIIKAKDLLVSSFKNSNVYRVGGDEFAVILEGTDFYKRDFLALKIVENNQNSTEIDDLVLAWGYSDYNKETDKCVCDVFNRADEKMYKNKRMLKEIHKI